VDDTVECLVAALHRVDFPRVPVEGNLDCLFFDMGGCMMFTNKLVLCQYCKPFFEAIYMVKILAFHRVFELAYEIDQQPVPKLLSYRFSFQQGPTNPAASQITPGS
jgi:hypothetical protein